VRICRGSSKTVEGTLSAVAATLAGWVVLASAGWLGDGLGSSFAALHSGAAAWALTVAATALSCLLEAATCQLDNIFVPLHYYALLCLL
jgi:dolichol kinase